MIIKSHFRCESISFVSFFLYRKYSSSYFFEEMRGLADGAGVEYDLVVRVHMLPELVKVVSRFLNSNRWCYLPRYCTWISLEFVFNSS